MIVLPISLVYIDNESSKFNKEQKKRSRTIVGDIRQKYVLLPIIRI